MEYYLLIIEQFLNCVFIMCKRNWYFQSYNVKLTITIITFKNKLTFQISLELTTLMWI